MNTIAGTSATHRRNGLEKKPGPPQDHGAATAGNLASARESQPTIPDILSYLGARLEGVHEAFGALARILDPVMEPAGPAGEDDAERLPDFSGRSQIERTLASHLDSLEQLNFRIHDLIQRAALPK